MGGASTGNGRETAGRARLDAAALFAVAFLARLVVVLHIQSNDLFGTPIVDAASYADQARALAAGAPMTEALFWQPIFYPLFLSLVFRLAGPSLFAARVVQALLGALSCVMVYAWVRRLDGRRTARLAGLLLAFYGPVVVLESDLLSEGLTVFGAALLLWLFTRAGPGARPLTLGILGVAGGLAILVRPTFIPFIGGAGLWLTWTASRQRGWKPGLDAAVTWGAGLMLALLPAAALCRQHTGRFSVLPSGTGLNLYLGNNPRWVETVSIRPGVEWTELIREPQRAGRSDIWDQSDYFREKAAAYARSRPGDFARGLLEKTQRFFCSREIPRNHDAYLLREASPWLRRLMWKAGGFGFPFGLLFPLALLGLLTRGRRLGAPALLFLALYPPPVIAVFASDRYRIPMIPALAAAAALGLAWLWHAVAARRWGRGLLSLAAMAAVAALISIPRSYPEEQLPFRAERHWAVGKRLTESGRAAAAETHLRRAAELDPSMVDAWNDLGVLLESTGRKNEAIEAYRRAVDLAPSNAGLRHNLEAALK